ncbi:MAG TPA: glutamine amidotransferase [Longimicrobiales bacterium]
MASVAEQIFEFLFKYRPLVFRNGALAFDAPSSWVLPAVIAAALVLLVVWAYVRARSASRRDRAVSAVLRLAALAVLLFCLARPVLRVPAVVPQENWIGVLLDDSRSMRIADVDGATRGDVLRRHFGPQGDVLAALAQRFRLRFFRFSDFAARVDGAGALSFAGARTDLGAALDRARGELSSVPLSGLVLVTDGADNTTDALTAPLLALEAARVPVFTVGVGREAFERDIEIARVSAPRTVLQGGAPVVDVVVTQTGYAGRTVELVVEEGGRIVTTESVRLAEDGAPQVVHVPVPADEPGSRLYRFRIAAQPGEPITENNAREAVVMVRDGRREVLYFEGVPRFEAKFLRRAVEEDGNLRLVVLQRTADDRFLRLDVDSAAELAGGFPATREELFAYRGLILGSVEASFFTHDQLEMIADFVGRRGGGLLMLGGRRAFAEGGWAGTPVADVLPVELDDARRGDTTFFAEIRIGPTRTGSAHPVLRLAEDDDSSAARWAALPPLTTVNRVGGLKPGAVALLRGVGPALPEGQVVLATQRYGRGRAAAFVVQDTWLWQMHADIPVEDDTHERLWRQLLRWLIADAPDRVRVALPSAPVRPDAPVTIRAELDDATFLGINDARVVAHVTTPSGAIEDVPLSWSVDRDGLYLGRFMPEAEGPYEVRIEAARDGEVVESERAVFRVAPGDDEFFGAQMHAPLLRRIADRTGGRFYTPETVASLPEDIAYTARGITIIEEKELWDMPAGFLLVVLLLLAEWAYRRRRGLA